MNLNITDFGAISDGVTRNTDAIQQAIDACASAGGGKVCVPCGTFMTGTIYLRDNVELHLEHSAVLLANPDMEDYNDVEAYPQNFSSALSEEWVGKHLILAIECKNVALTGTGAIDGNADVFFEEPQVQSHLGWRHGIAKAKDKEKLRPGQLVCFIECEDVTVTDVTFRKMPCWGLFLHGCERVSVRGYKAYAREYHANTDGIDIDCCRHVTVSDCIIQTGDDAIAIRGAERKLKNKKACEYVTITNCVLGSYACAIRVGVGTGNIRHIRLSNITVTNGGNGIQLMTDYESRGCVNIEDVSFTNFSMDNCAWPIKIIENSGAKLRDITFDGFNVTGYAAIRMLPANQDTTENIALRNFTFHLVDNPHLHPDVHDCASKTGRGLYALEAKNIRCLRIENFKLYADKKTLSTWEISDFEGCREKIENGFEVITDEI